MGIENDFLKDFDGVDPDGFVYSLDRRGLARRVKDFVLSLRKPTPDYRNLPDDIIVIEENEER